MIDTLKLLVCLVKEEIKNFTLDKDGYEDILKKSLGKIGERKDDELSGGN